MSVSVPTISTATTTYW